MIKKKIFLKKIRNYRHIEKEWIKWLNDKTLNKYSLKKKNYHTIETQKKFLQKKISDKKNIIFRVYLGNNFIGICEIDNIGITQCEIKYMIGNKKYLKKGHGSSLIKKMVFFCKNTLKVKKIFAGVVDKNIASLKVLKKNGFKKIDKKMKPLTIDKKKFNIIFFKKLIY